MLCQAMEGAAASKYSNTAGGEDVIVLVSRLCVARRGQTSPSTSIIRRHPYFGRGPGGYGDGNAVSTAQSDRWRCDHHRFGVPLAQGFLTLPVGWSGANPLSSLLRWAPAPLHCPPLGPLERGLGQGEQLCVMEDMGSILPSRSLINTRKQEMGVTEEATAICIAVLSLRNPKRKFI
ncbi:hypothetical protein AAFF_G00030950 [Aldrovandia affinis]|uniref:Uncharacterized protein n=1 Tax=Aldrovandia affinis TaxID=143900 RepID=A0AAD7S436_9TELE|nr:hypothetical protein AAFF_G00030950 [Aldrovandia affinis]